MPELVKIAGQIVSRQLFLTVIVRAETRHEIWASATSEDRVERENMMGDKKRERAWARVGAS